MERLLLGVNRMKQITSLTSSANQSVTFVTNEGNYYKLTFRYLPTQLYWVWDIVGDDFELYNQRVCCGVNLLDKYHNILRFGISIWTTDGQEPFTVDAFSSGYASLYVLSENELGLITGYLDGN